MFRKHCTEYVHLFPISYCFREDDTLPHLKCISLKRLYSYNDTTTSTSRNEQRTSIDRTVRLFKDMSSARIYYVINETDDNEFMSIDYWTSKDLKMKLWNYI